MLASMPLVVAFVAAAALTAFAGDVLQMKDGRLVAGKVVSVDDEGLEFAPEAGGAMHVSWDAVVPQSRFDLWESTLAADDATGRVALAKWALSADLFPYARREFVKAKGLGYAGPEKLDDLIAATDKEEADTALAEADAHVAAGELEEALESVKKYLKVAPPGADADRVRSRVPDILARIERRDAVEKEEEEAKKKAEKAGKLKDWIEKNMDDAAKAQTAAGDHAIQGFAELAKGNQTRARDQLSAAESGFQDARTTYRRVKKAAGAGPVADACDKQMENCDARTVEVLVRWGRMEVENKAWKRASPIVDRGLKIDPVDRELLELRRTIDASWLRRKVSEVTNAKGHESN
jgi:tetratricopeptide (TPR) repeat protein